MDGSPAAPPPRSGREWAGIGLLFCVAAVTLLFELGESHTFGSHEVFVAVPAREMLSTGHWMVPTYGHLPRLEKPPLAYWTVAASGWLAGQIDEWTARLPSALAAAALAACVGWWAKTWYGRAAGFGAALAQLTSVWVLTWGRKAEVDMILCLLTTASLFLAAKTASAEAASRPRLWDVRWIGFFCLLGLAWLAKFHYGPVMVLAPVVIFFVLTGHRGDWKHLVNPVGLLLFAAAVIIWPVLVLRQLPEAWSLWTEQTVGRALGQMGHEPVWFYLPQLLVLSLPWTPVALLAVGESWRRAWKQNDRRERFLWIWLLVQLAIVTASSDKHPNYLLASMPVISLWAGRGFAKLVAVAEAGRLRLPGRHAALLVGLALIGTAVAWAIGAAKKPTAAASITSLAMVIAAGVLLLGWLLWRGRAGAAGLASLLVFLASDAIVVGRILPQVDHRVAAARFGRDVRARWLQGQTVAVYRMDQAHNGMDPIVFYVGEPVRRVESAETLANDLHARASVYVIAYETREAELARLARTEAMARMTVPADRPPPKHSLLVLFRLTRANARPRDSDLSRPPQSDSESDADTAGALAGPADHVEARRLTRQVNRRDDIRR